MERRTHAGPVSASLLLETVLLDPCLDGWKPLPECHDEITTRRF